ncbi:MAG TPA: Lrp/AsnC family transcriptional regulator [Vicinamibacterales bacterium]|nr:Lrp/AsnC family transcriptional regulator [Vicinamibacterales bacterium]
MKMKNPPHSKAKSPRRPAHPRPAVAAAPSPPAHPDADADLNWQIISLLQEDGRMPFSTIAEKVGVSEGTVRNRVNQLREQNVMQITAQVLPQAFDYTWNSVVFLRINSAASLEAVARRFADIPEVYYVVHMTGEHDLAVTSFHRDRDHFREFLNRHFYGQPEILSVDANVNLKVYKMKLKWQVMALDAD